MLLQPRYTAKSQIVVEPQPNGLAGSSAVVVAQPEDSATVLTEVTKINSHDFLQKVLASLSPPLSTTADSARPSEHSANFGGALQNAVKRWLPASLGTANTHGSPDLEQFERELKIDQEHGSHVITISVTSANPREAVAAANRVAELYVKGQQDEKLADSDRVLAWLDRRIPDQRREIERLQVAIQDYKAVHGILSKDKAGINDQQLAELNRQLAVAQSNLAAQQARLANLRDQRLRGTNAAALVGTPELPALTELRRQELVLLQAQANVAATLGEMHPKMQQIRSQLQEVRNKIVQLVDQAVSGLASDEQVAAAEVRGIQRRIAAGQGANSDSHLEQLEHDASSAQHIYESLQQRREELREQRELISPGVAILSLASLPTRPSSSNPILFVPPAFVVFLVCGCFLAITLERLDVTLRGERDIVDALGIPCLGLVPRMRRTRRERPHQLLTTQPFGPYTEGVRSIVAAMGLAGSRSPPKVIMLSSSLPREGKTTLAVSIAAYTALLGRRTILVDLDFRHPAVLRELVGKAGRTRDLLPPDRLNPDPIHHVARLNLDYLALPRDSTDPMARFAGEYMSRLLVRLRATYDCVIVDSAPVLAVTETRVLAALVDKVLFVVKWGATRREIAQNALRLLGQTELGGGARTVIAGAAITHVDLRKHARYRYGDAGECLVEYGKRYLIGAKSTETRSSDNRQLQ
jgi:uncharacterized protein involved in exopolysaccharide biosynthesis